jgi:hypothetical protein
VPVPSEARTAPTSKSGIGGVVVPDPFDLLQPSDSYPAPLQATAPRVTLRNDVGSFDGAGNPIGIVFETVTPFDTPRRVAKLIAWLAQARDLRRLLPLLIFTSPCARRRRRSMTTSRTGSPSSCFSCAPCSSRSGVWPRRSNTRIQILDYAQAHGRVTTRDMVREHSASPNTLKVTFRNLVAKKMLARHAPAARQLREQGGVTPAGSSTAQGAEQLPALLMTQVVDPW